MPGAFSAEVLAEAERLPRRAGRAGRARVRDDRPAGRARPRPGDAHRATRATGSACPTRSPTPASFIAPGGALDREAHARGVTLYRPTRRSRCIRRCSRRARRSPAARRVAARGAVDARPRRGRRAVGDRCRRGGWCAASRSTPTTTCPADLAPLLREVGERRLAARARPRRRAARACPSRRSCQHGDGWTRRYRVRNEYEEYNAQISLLCGMAAATMMLAAEVGILRTQPAPYAARASSGCG